MGYARALVEHPMWTQWRKGMVDDAGCVCSVDGIKMGKARLPDINHPATKGWLLHMLIGVVEAVHFETAPHGGTEVYVKWSLNGETKRKWFSGDEALAAALLAVWGQA